MGIDVRLEEREHEQDDGDDGEPVVCMAEPDEGDGQEDDDGKPVVCMAEPGEGEGDGDDTDDLSALAPPAGLSERWRAKVGGASETEFAQVWTELTAFLRECASSGRAMRPPSVRVDVLWHEFILFTRDYHAFCNRLGVGYIHHTPDVS